MTSSDETPVAPDRRTLIRATGLAVAAALVVLVVAVLPAEYGVDPTGIGGALGLTSLDQTGRTQAPAVRVGGTPFQVETAQVTVPGNDGLEWKLEVEEGAALVFSWETNGTALYTDLHGEPDDAPKGEFTSWEQTTTGNQSGDMRAPFSGTVGWYWENREAGDATVSIRVAGTFTVVGTLG